MKWVVTLKSLARKSLKSLLFLFILGFLLPEIPVIPVQQATIHHWHPQSFWHYPWGRSITHKGIDIFAQTGTPVLASTYGLVLFRRISKIGGKTLLLLGPKWRLHYYAHLNDWKISAGSFVYTGQIIGEVGTTGNAQGKAPHLHYAVLTLVPYLWRWDNSPQGWKKIFYLDPGHWLVTE